MKTNTQLGLDYICKELGLEPQFLYALAANAERYYNTFERKKRTGGTRLICASQDKLKLVQRSMLDGLLNKVPVPAHVHGGVKGRSIVTNAEGHVNKPVVINIDLRDFFGSVTFDILMSVFQDKLGFDWESAQVLTRLSTYNDRLPQGAPTSPMLANLAALDLDEEIIRLCQEQLDSSEADFRYSRYIDDITISGATQLPQILPQIYDRIVRHGFEPNREKTKILRRSTQQNVTGIVVNKKVSPPKKLLRRLRQQIYYCHKYGIYGHCNRNSLSPEKFVRKLRGQIAYIRQTRPELADQLTYVLGQGMIGGQIQSTPTEFELKVRQLYAAISDEKIVTFSYGRTKTQCKAAPSSLDLDEKGAMILLAFQLSPEQGWMRYEVALMNSIELE